MKNIQKQADQAIEQAIEQTIEQTIEKTKQHLAPKNRSSKQRGNAILFTLLALVIGGIVIGVGVGQYQDAERAMRVQSAVAEINTIIATAKQNYAQYRYVGVNTASAVASRVIPSERHQTATTAQNSFGGAIDLIGPGNQAAALLLNGSMATLTYAGVPVELCGGIVNGTQALADAVGTAAAAAATPTPAPNDLKAIGGAFQAGNLAAQCTGATAAGGAVSPTVNLAWTFGR